jgi:hypothetical protein
MNTKKHKSNVVHRFLMPLSIFLTRNPKIEFANDIEGFPIVKLFVIFVDHVVPVRGKK